jgi:hypothetical protein
MTWRRISTARPAASEKLAGVAFSSPRTSVDSFVGRPPSETASVVANRLVAATSAGTKAWGSEATLGR